LRTFREVSSQSPFPLYPSRESGNLEPTEEVNRATLKACKKFLFSYQDSLQREMMRKLKDEKGARSDQKGHERARRSSLAAFLFEEQRGEFFLKEQRKSRVKMLFIKKAGP